MKTIVLTAVAMLAFAANSLLCRAALGAGLIDAASFTTVRLLSGALTLGLLLLFRRGLSQRPAWDLPSSLALFAYALGFSLAYRELATGTGALILFGMVQLTMIGWGLWQGARLTAGAVMGILLAVVGLVYLLAPGVTAPPWQGALLMAVAGMSWGIYSLRGKGVREPLVATGWNFIATLPLALLVAGVGWTGLAATPAGLGLAIASGALASGLGYAVWYAALPMLAPTSAATVQLSVPVIAAGAGVLFLGEPLTLRLSLASLAILGGIYLVIRTRQKATPSATMRNP